MTNETKVISTALCDYWHKEYPKVFPGAGTVERFTQEAEFIVNALEKHRG